MLLLLLLPLSSFATVATVLACMLPAPGKKGVMAAWELRLADYSVETFDDMTVLDFRQLFADREFEPGMMQLEVRIYGGIGETDAEGGGRGGQGTGAGRRGPT